MITTQQVWEAIPYSTRLALIAGLSEEYHIHHERLARTMWSVLPEHTREAIHAETTCEEMDTP